jgi:translocation and assembly module TamB
LSDEQRDEQRHLMPDEQPHEPMQQPEPSLKRRGIAGKIARVAAWVLGSLVLLVVVLLGGLAWYSTTPDFNRRVGAEVVSVLETATGGRVELGHISFNLWHLAIEADGLVIHGLEGPGEAPYFSADRILVRLKLVSFLQHTTGTGPASHIGLDLLRVEAPKVHLIVDKDGKTNQPVPRHPSVNTTPVQDTLLDLKAREVELVHGVARLNDRAIPFNLTAQDLNANVHYIAANDSYGATIDLRDLRTQMVKEPEVKSSLHLEAQLGRDMAALTAFDLHSGEHSELQASAALNHFASPRWQVNAAGSLELKQIELLTGAEGLEHGSLELNVAGHSCSVAPAVAQRKPRLLDRLRNRHEAQTSSEKTLPPDPECQKGYLLVGSVKTHHADYVDQYVRIRDVNASAQLKVTPSQLLFSALTGRFETGGSASGELKIDDWLGEVPQNTEKNTETTSATVKGAIATANKTSIAVTGTPSVSTQPTAAKVATAHAYLTVNVDKIPLRTIMLDTAPKGYGDLGFDTAINGPVKVEWGGAVADISDTVMVDADLTLAPVGSGPMVRVGKDIPVSGRILGHYDGKREVVNVTDLALTTPESSLTANGVLGVNVGDPLTALNVNLTVKDLSEYDTLLTTLGLAGNGRKGAKAIPVNLHGTAVFQGTARGEIAKLDVKGHLQANNLEVRLGDFTAPPSATQVSTVRPGAPTVVPAAQTGSQTDVHIDSLVADAEYTPSGLAVGSSTITQGTAVLHVAGTFKPRTVVKRRVTTYVWDQGTRIDTNVQLANASVVDLLTLAGQQQKIPVTGTISVNGHAAGTLTALNGSGKIALTDGVAYGEPYQSATVNLSVQGQDFEASNAALKLHGMTIEGNGGYDLGNKHLHAHVVGANLQLSKFQTVQNLNLNADALVSVNVDANGTIEQPGLQASVKLANLEAQGKPLGDATLTAHSTGTLAYYSLRSNVVGAQVTADGQTDLTGNYQTQAKLTLAGFDVQKALAIFQPGGMVASSDIAGTVTVSGPAKIPTQLVGQASFSAFSVTSQGITLKTAEPLRIGLRNGLATLDAVHISGPDTDMRATGTAQVFGATDPKTGQPSSGAGRLNVNALGSINVALAHTFDPDLITSGKVVFSVGAAGTLSDPRLTGDVQFQNVNAAVEGIPNGLSNMNGTLQFNQNRLVVKSLTATTGGGQLNLGGFLSYRNGVFADLTATGETVRVRLYGLSATANASLRLQGGPQSALLSGNILLTRFGIGQDVDFAAFAGGGGLNAPPDPSAPSNKIRMDVHVVSSPQLDFQNSYAKLAGTVDLTVRGTVAEPSVLGRIQITDGSASFAGVNYQLQRGNIYFSNPVRIDPTIDLDATARVETYDVTVGVHGTSSNLKTTYRSDPPLTEADIFSLLALGQTQEEAQIQSEQETAAGTDPTTNALLGGALNATVSSRVSKLFGGASVKIDPAYVGSLGGSSARITVTQQVTQQITFTFATNVNYSAQQLIQVAYALTPNTSIVATRDESGVFSLVYKIRKRYR